ncbi:relaxation protein [Xanthomonas hortorum]|uniref:Relaxation protein n=1 Tax=Xanthomonas hortorum pv. hederae TaxID=453603 RepID=A0A9X4BT51_9XANT|nr:relaxation protein [Xanthomonas hortorum]MCE4372194.1 relaxation protein [Xanthomonas hortorum pv. hederae]MDC8639136.1 relaxation protein [Xanthomonas hortorum pv. hederae]PPU79624.1 relaxation protein [Xanthomonas hortorum pv. hederae]PUE99280.1 relaxation protein [Xanthomonas hortorum pv. hederae]
MNAQDPMALVSKAATLMEQFERRCAELEQLQRRLAQQLEQVAQSLPSVVTRSAEQTLQRVPDTLIRSIQQGLDQPVAGFEKRLQQAGGLIGEGAQSLSDQLKRIERGQRLLLWKGAAVILGSLLMLLGGGGWLLAHYRQQIEDNQLHAELLRAYNAADVTLCNGRLCANVETKGPDYGDRRQYRPVKPR